MIPPIVDERHTPTFLPRKHPRVEAGADPRTRKTIRTLYLRKKTSFRFLHSGKVDEVVFSFLVQIRYMVFSCTFAHGILFNVADRTETKKESKKVHKLVV